jgi:hypothetical protein
MRTTLNQLWDDDGGQLIAMELLFISAILILGLIVGFTGLRNAIVVELTELGNAILALNLSFSFSGLTGCCSSVAGSQAIDIPGTLLTPPTCTPPTPVVIDVPVPCT